MPSKKERRRQRMNARDNNRGRENNYNGRDDGYGFNGERDKNWGNSRDTGRKNNRKNNKNNQKYGRNNSHSQKGSRGQDHRRGGGSNWDNQGGDPVYGFRKFRDDVDNRSRDERTGAEHRRFNLENQFYNEQANASNPFREDHPHEDNIAPNTTEPMRERKQSESSTDSSSSGGTEDSVVRDLKDAVNDTLLSGKAIEPNNSQNNLQAPAVQCNHIETQKEKTESKPAVKVKKEPTSKSESSSSSSSSSSEESSSSSDDNEPRKAASVEDVICLGKLEKIENLLEDEVAENSSKCALCDKTGHISFHCQMICKNCNGKYHGLKDCPKPANLSIVFSNFIQFCLKQSCMYNPGAEFVVDENMQLIPSAASAAADGTNSLRSVGKKRKRKSHPRTPRVSNRKRHKSTTSSSSDSSSSDTSSRKRKRRNTKSDSHQTPPPIPFAVPYQPVFNPTYGFGSSGGVNPLLAFSQMMGLNPGSMNFRSDSVAKEL